MTDNPIDRRVFLGATAAGVLAGQAGASVEEPIASEEFVFEVTRSESEWRSILTDEEYAVLRNKETEPKFHSELTNEEREGTYHCKACDLTLYDSKWKVPLDIGWVFFRHARPHSVVTAIDKSEHSMNGMAFPEAVPITAECRRCGSHLGHIVYAQGNLVHCINGTGLTFCEA